MLSFSAPILLDMYFLGRTTHEDSESGEESYNSSSDEEQDKGDCYYNFTYSLEANCRRGMTKNL